jgi:hypothetical protein
MSGNSNPVWRLMRHFGTQQAMALGLGVGQSTIADWVANEKIPYHRIPMIIEAAARLNPPIHLEPNDFFLNYDSSPKFVTAPSREEVA